MKDDVLMAIWKKAWNKPQVFLPPFRGEIDASMAILMRTFDYVFFTCSQIFLHESLRNLNLWLLFTSSRSFGVRAGVT